MRTELRVLARAGELPRITATGGLTARHTAPDTIHLIGTAATPLGGDDLDIRIVVGPGARLVIRSVAATLALPGAATVSSWARWRYEVDTGALLEVEPEPMIVAGGARHHARTEVLLAADARIRLRERVQIGRVGEDGGGWVGDLVADVDGVALVRHRLALGVGCGTDDVLAAPRALDSELVYPDDRPASVDGLTAARLPLAGGGSLFTGLGRTLPVADRRDAPVLPVASPITVR
ncbi:urease accessory protein UreD [Nocardia arizonensis]|uniref:urease accessory protein UreD n=1 Tax=Nocardia arizonensis TaxID=1141647 RepID=UPI0007A755AB|nr:urease accessory protein UreD [Nocardia arizonensis]